VFTESLRIIKQEGNEDGKEQLRQVHQNGDHVNDNKSGTIFNALVKIRHFFSSKEGREH
jgi:hypothetical protein